MKKVVSILAISTLLAGPSAKADYGKAIGDALSFAVKAAVVLSVVVVAEGMYITYRSVQDGKSPSTNLTLNIDQQKLSQLNIALAGSGGILALSQRLFDADSKEQEAIIAEFGGSEIVREYVSTFFRDVPAT